METETLREFKVSERNFQIGDIVSLGLIDLATMGGVGIRMIIAVGPMKNNIFLVTAYAFKLNKVVKRYYDKGTKYLLYSEIPPEVAPEELSKTEAQ
jgi:hypothetical protein